jgi:hypothetical protein
MTTKQISVWGCSRVSGLALAGVLSFSCTDVEHNGGPTTGSAGSTTNIMTGDGAGATGSAGSTSGAGSTGSAGSTSGGGSTGSTGGAGATGSAGSTDTAGTTGTAGSTSLPGTAGTTGAAGSTSTVDKPPCAAPGSALVTDFGTGKTLVGAPYKGADVGLAVPTVSTSTGALVIKLDTGPPSTPYPYAYVGLPLNMCTGAGAYTGVKFNISGTLSAGCTIQFSAVDQEHSTVANHGTCTIANCYPSSARFELPATPTDVTVLFVDQSGGGADPGVGPLDPAHLLNLQWQVNPAVGDAGGCTGTVTIDNVTFM